MLCKWPQEKEVVLELLLSSSAVALRGVWVCACVERIPQQCDSEKECSAMIKPFAD